MITFLKKHPWIPAISVLSAATLMYSLYLIPFGKEERLKNYDRQLTQIDSIYDKMLEAKNMKYKIWEEYFNLDKKADSIKRLLPYHYQKKAVSIRKKVLGIWSD
jgi:hypothetical protein